MKANLSLQVSLKTNLAFINKEQIKNHLRLILN